MSQAPDNARVAMAIMESEATLRELQKIRAAQSRLASTRPRPGYSLTLVTALFVGLAVGMFVLHGAIRGVFTLLCVSVTFLALDYMRVNRRLEAAIQLLEVSAIRQP